MPNYQITQEKTYSKIAFNAMASHCEVLVRNLDTKFCDYIAEIIYQETIRIQDKYSRYIKGNLVDKMNHSNDKVVVIDQETFKLLEYAKNLYELSDGKFDITSGILREIWNFTPKSKPPSIEEITTLLAKIGFDKIRYNQQEFIMPAGMQIDFGGIGKEYAVDQITQAIYPLCKQNDSCFLVNFGGDLSAVKFNQDDSAWLVGVESVEIPDKSNSIIKIGHGCVATSGNTKRFLDYKGKRYGHLLNPKTGYPIDNAPRSVTVFANSCVLAGSYSSLAILQGENAEHFLKEQSIKYICNW